MKRVKYKNNNYNNQIYSINYKFDSVSPAGKFCGTALDLIKKYNELAKEAQANGNYIEAEVFRQYAEHYRKIITEINERKTIRFNNKDSSQNAEITENEQTEASNSTENSTSIDVPTNESEEIKKDETLVETKVKSTKRSFKIVEVSNDTSKIKKSVKQKNKKTETNAVNE